MQSKLDDYSVAHYTQSLDLDQVCSFLLVVKSVMNILNELMVHTDRPLGSQHNANATRNDCNEVQW